jgi:pilus assembly protein FimV
LAVAFDRDQALLAGRNHAARGELDQAIQEYQSVVEHDPGDVQTWVLLADSLHRVGELDAAVDRYAHAANVLLEKGEVPNALQIFRQILNLAPERYDIHLRTGQAFERLRRFPEAVALYEKVAGVYLRSGNTREALMLYERVADLMPREVAKRLRLAELFSRERRVDDAVAQFQIGANFLRDAGRAEEFVRVAERLLYHKPLDAVTRDLVRVYLQIDQPRRALMKLNELLQRQQGDPEGLELLAETFVRLGKADKAASVVLELVKTQRHTGEQGVARSLRALRKAFEWATNPQQEQFLRKAHDELVAEHGDLLATSTPTSAKIPSVEREPTMEVDDFEELVDVEELDDFEELDEDEIVPEPAGLEPVEHAQPVARPSRVEPGQAVDDESRVAPRRHSLTQEVISEGTQQRGSEADEIDFDKQLEEVRVLMKYHLFEHALSHAEQILSADPQHPLGLELFAEILAALGRNERAAHARAALADQLIDRDPVAAARHVELALALIPGHPVATALSVRLADISGVAIGIADRDASDEGSDDDLLGGLEIDDEMLGQIETGDSLARPVDGSLAPKLGSDYDSGLHERPDPLGELEIDESMLDGAGDELDIRSADPGLHGELNALAPDDDFAISVDAETGDEELDEDDEGEFEDRFGLGADEDEDEDADQAAGEFGAPEQTIDGETTAVYEQPIIGRISPESAPHEPAAPEPEPKPATPEPEPEPEPEPVEWLDLSAELEELEFYLAQDLEDDALAAFNDLVELFPGHPELAKLAGRFGVEFASPAVAAPEPEPESQPEPEPEQVAQPGAVEELADEVELEAEPEHAEQLVDAAAPLLDLEDEDDDDDFLAGIFDDEVPRHRKQREVAIQTHEVEGADAGDHFDLGTAYREMGLFEKALAEYTIAAKDPRWQAKALVMMGTLRRQTGDDATAHDLFIQAVAAARTKDERCESNYELAMVQLALGLTDEGKQTLELVDAGYRDRDQKLAELV